MGEDDSRRYVEILTFTTNLEHIGDIIDKNLMELAAKKIKKRYAFSPEGSAELRVFHGRVLDHMRLALNVFATRDVALARRLLREKTTMRTAEFEATDSHFARLQARGAPQSIETSSIHLDIDPRPQAHQLASDLGRLSHPRGRRRARPVAAARHPAGRGRARRPAALQ